jgi:hypothetical protein
LSADREGPTGRSTAVPRTDKYLHVPSQMPSWLQVGVDVVHPSFGTGRVVEIGLAKGAPVVWVEFDRGDVKMLDPEWATKHVRPRESSDRTTPTDQSIRCDVCHGHPVVVTVTDSKGTQQFCREHKTTYRDVD